MDRRSWLETVVMMGCGLGVAGCSKSLQDSGGNDTTETPATHEQATDVWDTFEENSGTSSITASGTGTLAAGQYAVWESRAQGSQSTLDVSVTVMGNQTIDVFAMTADSFGRYRQRQEPDYYEEMVATDTSETTLTNDVDGNLHRLVFDNTAVFGSRPDGEATFEFEATVRY